MWVVSRVRMKSSVVGNLFNIKVSSILIILLYVFKVIILFNLIDFTTEDIQKQIDLLPRYIVYRNQYLSTPHLSSGTNIIFEGVNNTIIGTHRFPNCTFYKTGDVKIDEENLDDQIFSTFLFCDEDDLNELVIQTENFKVLFRPGMLFLFLLGSFAHLFLIIAFLICLFGCNSCLKKSIITKV